MSRTINFKYIYPYLYWSDIPRYGVRWASSSVTLNSCYTYPINFNNPVYCNNIKLDIEVQNTGTGSVTSRNWDLKAYRNSIGWYNLSTFFLPSNGKYTIDCSVNNTISRIALVPSANPGSDRTWNLSVMFHDINITETITTTDLETGQFQYGIFPNNYGIAQRVNEVFVNIDGVLKKAVSISANIDGTLTPLPSVYAGYYKTSYEQMRIYEFIPPSSGNYTITQKRISGDHEIRLYDSSFNMLDPYYFYNKTFTLTGGSLYYITVSHHCFNNDIGESYLQIYKT